MEIALVITGVAALIISIIAGVGTGSFFGFLMFVVSGASVALILFALTKIMMDQTDILHEMVVHNEFTRKLHADDITCSNCENVYENKYSTCPNCGHKETKRS